MQIKDLKDKEVYIMADLTMVQAVEVKPGEWQLWSIDDIREFEIKPNGDIVIIPFKVGAVDDLAYTGMDYDRELNEIIIPK